ncbi:MAG: glycerophosphodiester phosphodiesterase [Promethearchaeota archaeon]
MIFIAHRGFRVGVVENTFQAFNKSATLNMDYIEFDLQLSSDNMLYILHDSTLDRTMNAIGKISEYTSRELDEVRSKDGLWKIPSFNELIEQRVRWTSPTPKFMVELKGKGTGIPAAETILKNKLGDQVVFSGRNIIEIADAHEICPNSTLCLNITKCTQYPLEKFLQASSKKDLPLPFSMISLKSTHPNITQFIEKCHELKILALSWHFMDYEDPVERMSELVFHHIDGLLFDNPKTVSPIRAILKM